MSRAHIRSNLTLLNTAVGMGSDMVAYFPFTNHANDVIGDIQPTINSNTTITMLGIAIEEATTNLCTSTDFSVGWWKSASISTMEVVSVPFVDGTNVKAIKAKYTGSGDGNFGWNFSFVGAASKQFTLSFWVKADVSAGMYSSCFIQENGSTYRTNGAVSLNPVPTEWTRITISGAMPADSIDNLRIIFRPLGTTNGYIYYALPQVEQKGFATSFVNGSRTGSGRLDLPTKLITNEGTFVFKYIPIANKTYTDWPTILSANWWTSPITRDWVGLYRGNGWNTADTISWGYQDGSLATSMGGGSISGVNNRVGHELWLGIGWSLSEKRYGAWAYDATTKEILRDEMWSNTSFDGFNQIDKLCLGTNEGGGCANAIYSDLMIYDRLLNSREFLAVATSKFSFNTEEGVCT